MYTRGCVQVVGFGRQLTTVNCFGQGNPHDVEEQRLCTIVWGPFRL